MPGWHSASRTDSRWHAGCVWPSGALNRMTGAARARGPDLVGGGAGQAKGSAVQYETVAGAYRDPERAGGWLASRCKGPDRNLVPGAPRQEVAVMAVFSSGSSPCRTANIAAPARLEASILA